MESLQGSHGHREVATDLAKQAGLPADSEERARVEYILQMCLHGTANRAEIEDIKAVSNPHLNLRFQKRTRGLCVIECWVNVDDLDGKNSLSSVVNQGFAIGNEGFVFNHGSIDLPHYTNSNVKQFILCQVAIGVPYVMDAHEAAHHDSELVVPDGYDCIYLHPDKINTKSEQELPTAESVYQQKFLLKDSDLILPTYFVSCEIKQSKGRNTELCNACESSRAVVYCQADNASLCEHCDRSMHGGNRLLTKHKRIPIAEKPITTFGKCSHHPEQMLTYYCHLCQVPVCISCKMVGSHCSGEASTHKLTVIKEAYELAIMASSKDDPFLLERKASIIERKDKLNKRLQAVNLNAKEVEAEILRKAEAAINTLKQMTDKKISIILAENVDLNQQMLKINWLEDFLKTQQTELDPVEFLEAWSRHVRYRGELHHSSNHTGTNRSKSVHPDIAVEGSLSVVAKPYFKADNEDTEIEKPKAINAWDDDVFKKEKLIRDDLLRDLDSDIAHARPSSPTGSVSSIYSVAQSLAHSISNGVAAPGGRSLKELIAVYESGRDEEGQRSSSVPRHHPRRTNSRHRFGLRSDYSPAPFSTAKRGPGKEWTDIWSARSNTLLR